jgi:hypothetical protein
MAKKEYKPKPAIGYLGVDGATDDERSAVVDKIKTKLKRITLTVDFAALRAAGVDTSGATPIKLVGLLNDYKKKETHPDYNFIVSNRQPERGANRAAATGTGGGNDGFEL